LAHGATRGEQRRGGRPPPRGFLWTPTSGRGTIRPRGRLGCSTLDDERTADSWGTSRRGPEAVNTTNDQPPDDPKGGDGVFGGTSPTSATGRRSFARVYLFPVWSRATAAPTIDDPPAGHTASGSGQLPGVPRWVWAGSRDLHPHYVSVVLRYVGFRAYLWRAAHELQDFVQEALIGLWEAIRGQTQPGPAVTNTYVRQRARWSLIAYLAARDPLPEGLRGLVRHLDRLDLRLSLWLCRPATVEEICDGIPFIGDAPGIPAPPESTGPRQKPRRSAGTSCDTRPPAPRRNL